MSVAGLLHDIGKLEVAKYIYAKGDPLTIEEMKYVRTHATTGYAILNQAGYDKFITESVLYHHENYDGSGYPSNLYQEDIPFGARILRVCDTFAALTSKRPYREAFDVDTAVELMIDEAKNFDMLIFLAFLRVIHEDGFEEQLEGVAGGFRDFRGGLIMNLKKKPVTGMKDILPRRWRSGIM